MSSKLSIRERLLAKLDRVNKDDSYNSKMRPLPKIRVLSKTEDNRKRRKYELDPTGEELLLDKSASSDTSTL
jgi:hypothetical protein